MKGTTRGLLGLMLLTAPTALQAQFDYTTNADNTITIVDYTGPDSDVTIPTNINGLLVTVIGSGAFQNSTSLTNVTIPSSVASIGDYAFMACSSLTSVTVPNSVTNIGIDAFAYCSGLTAISVDAQNSFYSSTNGVLFDEDQETLIQYPGGMGGNYIIPGNVINIGDAAFTSCAGLTNITIPVGVTSIGDDAFGSCSGLSSVTIPGSVTNIEGAVFVGCAGLTAIIVDGQNAFYASINGVLFSTTPFAIIQYPPGMVGPYTIPGGVTNIGDYAFSGCSGLTSVTIPSGVTNIGAGAFGSCTSLTSVTIPNGVASIGINTFNSCTSLTNVTIPGSITNMGSAAFAGCSGLTRVTIPIGVTSIEFGEFEQCSSLTNITILGSITGIGQNAFVACRSLPNVTIPPTVTNIGATAFLGCSSLTSVTIPGGVTSIGQDAFWGCAGLTSVYFNGNAPTIGANVFGFDSATVYYLPGAAGWSLTFWGYPSSGPPAVPWYPTIQTGDGSFGLSNNQFEFNINWASGQTVVVEACSNLANPAWIPLLTNTLSNGLFYFSEPVQTNNSGRYYRISSP